MDNANFAPLIDANAPPGEPLTLEKLRGMGGQPVWIVEYPDWGHWELSENGEDYIADRDPELYGLRHDDPEGKFGLHKLGWVAYAYPPAIGSNQRKIGVEPLTTMDYTATVRAVKALKVERGSLSCLGCGYEDNCTLHGCAILRNAADHMEAALANHDHLTALLDQTEAALNAATARAEQAERERDFLIKLIHGECWACVRRYDCNSRLGPHRKCWEFDQSILQVRQGNSTC